MEEETKYDFSSYLLDKNKANNFNRSNTFKGASIRTGTKKGGFLPANTLSNSYTASGTKVGVASKTTGASGGPGNEKTPTKRVKNGVTKR